MKIAVAPNRLEAAGFAAEARVEEREFRFTVKFTQQGGSPCAPMTSPKSCVN